MFLSHNQFAAPGASHESAQASARSSGQRQSDRCLAARRTARTGDAGQGRAAGTFLTLAGGKKRKKKF